MFPAESIAKFCATAATFVFVEFCFAVNESPNPAEKLTLIDPDVLPAEAEIAIGLGSWMSAACAASGSEVKPNETTRVIASNLPMNKLLRFTKLVI
jgi:hypothetical protein